MTVLNRLIVFTILSVLFTLSGISSAQETEEPNRIMFTNVNVFDGVTDTLEMNTNVLVEDNLIKSVGPSITLPEGTEVIEGGGRTLMPGLIDSHVHLTHMVMPGGLTQWEASTWEELGAVTAVAAREFLMSGFTTVRDMGGMNAGFKKIIDRGDLVGPRIYPAGAYISQTSGHGDLRLSSQNNPVLEGRPTSNLQRLNIIKLADGVPAVLNASRENFANGAVYLKIMGGGGVSSAKDPLHTLQYTADEISAAVEAAENWDTYVSTHIYTSEGISRAIDLGIKCIDHGHFIDDATMQKLVAEDVFLSTNLASFSEEVLDHPVYGDPNGPQYKKVLPFLEAKDSFIDIAGKHKPRMVFNSDVVLSDLPSARAIRDNSMYLHATFFSNFDALTAMTSVAGELAQLTGLVNPYPNKLGVIQPGAYADILLVDGNPMEDISVLGARSKIYNIESPRGETVDTINLIMKDGKIYKNSL